MSQVCPVGSDSCPPPEVGVEHHRVPSKETITLYFPFPPELLTVKFTAAVHDGAFTIAVEVTVQSAVIDPVVKVDPDREPPKQPDTDKLVYPPVVPAVNEVVAP